MGLVNERGSLWGPGVENDFIQIPIGGRTRSRDKNILSAKLATSYHQENIIRRCIARRLRQDIGRRFRPERQIGSLLKYGCKSIIRGRHNKPVRLKSLPLGRIGD